MAKNYKNKDKRVHPITWGILVLIPLVLILTIVLLQPSATTRFFNEYETTAITQVGETQPVGWNEDKLPKKGNVIKQLNEKDLLKKIEAGETILVYFGDSKNQLSAGVIQEVHARLVGNRSADASDSDKKPADIYKEKLIEVIYHVQVKDTDAFKVLAGKINELLDKDTKYMSNQSYPALVAFGKLNGNDEPQVLKEATLTSQSTAALTARNLYKDLLELLKK